MEVVRAVSMAAGALAILTCASVSAEVISVAAGGFQVHESLHVAATPDKAYALLVTPSRWWSADHTFSKNADNLYLEARAGGCWCEKLADGGSVEHLHVLWAAPGKALRLRGALGPFQALPVEGVLSFTIKPVVDGSEVTLDYSLGGYNKEGFDALAKIADKVMSEQLVRYGKALEN